MNLKDIDQSDVTFLIYIGIFILFKYENELEQLPVTLVLIQWTLDKSKFVFKFTSIWNETKCQ